MTLEPFRTCDNTVTDFAYIRIGLYFVTKKHARVNFCDVHLMGVPGVDRSLWGGLFAQGVYSGPTESTKQVANLSRSDDDKDNTADVQRYFLQGKVSADLDLSRGGWAQLIFKKGDHSQLDIWLLGPLLFQGVALGSLVARLQGWAPIKSTIESTPIAPIPCDPTDLERDEETGCSVEAESKALHKRWKQQSDPRNHHFKLVVPEGFGMKYLPCKLFGSDYSEGTRPRSPDKAVSTPPTMTAALSAAKKRLEPAILPRNVTSVAWKIEDYADELTECQLYTRAG